MSSRPVRLSGAARASRAPGPRGIALVRALADYRRNSLAALERLRARYGDIVRVDLVGKRAFLLAHPDLIHQVLITRRDAYQKLPGSLTVRRFFGNAMQLDNGDYARRMRRMMAPAFQPDRFAAAYTDTIVRATHAAIAGWNLGAHSGITQELMDLALDITVQIHLGTEPGEATRRLGRAFVAAVSSLSNFMLPDWVPTPRNRRYHRAVAALDQEVISCIDAHRRAGADSPSLASVLMGLEDDAGRSMTDRQIRDEIVTMMSAGYQSIGIALNQTLRLIAEHPAVEERLANELDHATGDRDPADLAALPYGNMVVKEALRCCPPAGVIARRAVVDDTAGAFVIPAGSLVFMSAWVTHRDPRFFDEPLSFNPERWSSRFERDLPMCAYFPFGRGPRSCIAGSLSSHVVQLIVAVITRRYRLEAIRRTPPDQSAWPALLAAGGLQVTLEPR